MTLTLHSEKSSPTPISRPPAPHPIEPDQTANPSTATSVVRIILADSQAIYRVGMRKIFALEDDIRVVAQVDNLQNLEAAIQRFPTDLVILEGGLITGTTDAIPAIVRRNPQVKIIIQAVSTDE